MQSLALLSGSSDPGRLCRAPRQQLLQRLRASSSDGDGNGTAGSEGATSSSGSKPEGIDLNQVQTALNVAIAGEDYVEAARLRDILTKAMGEQQVADWHKLGLPEWLAERAERLGYRQPTEVQKRAAPVILDADDLILRSATGSGKTMSFLLPAMARLDYPPDLLPEDLEGPELVIVVPTRELGVQIVMLAFKLLGGSVNAGVPGEASNMFAYSGPRGIKVRGLVLPDELGSVRSESFLQGVHVLVATPQLLAAAIQSTYKGGSKDGAKVDVFHDTKVLVVDEVDECFKVAPEEMRILLDSACQERPPDPPSTPTPASTSPPAPASGDILEAAAAGAATGESASPAAQSRDFVIPGAPPPVGKPQIVFVGATVEPHIAELAVQSEWMEDPISVCVGATGVPPGLQHRYIVASQEQQLAAMARQMRVDLKEQGDDAPPARVMVFARSEDEAKGLAEPLRNVMWGEHKISVLLPGGEDPIRALHAFRDNQSTLLLATPSAARGLDLPALSHVYNVGVPDDATSYLHRAGRAGRIGSTVKGMVTTIVAPEQLLQLQRMAEELGIELVEEQAQGADLTAEEVAKLAGEGEGLEEQQLDKLRRGLEDIFNLY